MRPCREGRGFMGGRGPCDGLLVKWVGPERGKGGTARKNASFTN